MEARVLVVTVEKSSGKVTNKEVAVHARLLQLRSTPVRFLIRILGTTRSLFALGALASKDEFSLKGMLELIDSIWVRMSFGEFYSVRDVANSLDQPMDKIGLAINFLAEYGYVEKIADFSIFRKLPNRRTPTFHIRLLKSVHVTDAAAPGRML